MGKKIVLILCIVYILCFGSLSALAFDSSSTHPVHQHITNESQKVWNLIPYEIKQHLNSSLSEPLNGKCDADEIDDIITGSGEEDVPITETFRCLEVISYGKA